MTFTRLTEYTDGFDVTPSGKLVLRHRSSFPALYLGAGEPTARMNHGHFKVTDYLTSRVSLSHAAVTTSPEGVWHVTFAAAAGTEPLLEMRISAGGHNVLQGGPQAVLELKALAGGGAANRL